MCHVAHKTHCILTQNSRRFLGASTTHPTCINGSKLKLRRNRTGESPGNMFTPSEVKQSASNNNYWNQTVFQARSLRELRKEGTAWLSLVASSTIVIVDKYTS